MIVQMVVQMSGSRYDDRMWPPSWINFEVPDEEGRGLIRAGAAMEVVRQAPEPGEPLQSVTVTGQGPQPVTTEAVAQPPSPVQEGTAAVQEQETAAGMPAPADPKSAWVAYAMAHGSSEVDANNMTKAQLQAQYGGRMLAG
jgi:hypothetical protein